MLNRLRLFGLLIVALVAVARATAQKATLSSPSANSCRAFVQDFYDWYVPVVLRSGKEAPWHVALRRRKEDFSTELAEALRQSDVEAKAEGDPVLDFEPLLNTQDPARRYEVGAVSSSNDRCSASISAAGKSSGELPDVIAELAKSNGHWMFVNFNYPDPDPAHVTWVHDLLGILNYHYKPN